MSRERVAGASRVDRVACWFQVPVWLRVTRGEWCTVAFVWLVVAALGLFAVSQPLVLAGCAVLFGGLFTAVLVWSGLERRLGDARLEAVVSRWSAGRR